MRWDRTGRDGITPRIPCFAAGKSRSRKLIPNVRERSADWDREPTARSRNSGRSFAAIQGKITKITDSN